jgi:hypothetical protein
VPVNSSEEQREGSLSSQYDVTILTVRPGTSAKALDVLKDPLASASDLLACWYSDIGALNRILLLRNADDPGATMESRMSTLTSTNPFGIGDLITGMAMDTYVAFDFMPPIKPGEIGPCFEVRTYILKPDGLAPTIELWRKQVPRRNAISPLLAAMTSVSGVLARFMHIWPYQNLEERNRLRAKAVEAGVWPPPGGPSHLVTQQADIYFPATYSPLR